MALRTTLSCLPPGAFLRPPLGYRGPLSALEMPSISGEVTAARSVMRSRSTSFGDPHVRATGFYRKLGWQATGTFMGNNEVLKLGKGKNPIANTPTKWTATISTSASEQDQ